MTPALHRDSSVSLPVRWSISAGLYTFVCGIGTVVLLADLLVLLGDVIGLEMPYSLLVFASPTLVIGTIAWWLLVERRRSYTYRTGVVFGLVTALLTGLPWSARFVDFWGVEMLVIPIIAFFVIYVLGITTLLGVLTGLPLMYIRRRIGHGRPG